ncbi:MAG: tetratricopeptide repeat protein [Firmicutes bacterium]|nr:tetratricopeptide repeat protein [Bacillota bacterium]
MSKLLYKTVAGERPQGKPYVYFSCHPDDLKEYFGEYAQKIMNIQDCAFWYESEPEAAWDAEELEAELSQMQLFVMPVTTKLLSSPNRAMDAEFPLALRRRIPVLPLMMESGLSELYSRRFGDLQYLDPNDSDDTRRSFGEALSSYIRSTLVSDETAKRVRAAFDAYIFLSYRKKDRRQAQELMRLIHSNPACRDIAIWYDEFLTPGEDFNRAIEEMLEKSDFLALAVTPNLVNEANYVMTNEYPAALERGKPVLPVEMVETDRSELEAHYEGLPPCVPGRDSEEFREALAGKLRGLALSESGDRPEHNYLIGLAYLDGIDVEVDPRRAEELIRGAAEAGVPEAMEKLAAMYESGKGVERDLSEGLEWRRRHTVKLMEDFSAGGPSVEKFYDIVRDLLVLGDARMALHLTEDALESYEMASNHALNLAAIGKKEYFHILAVSLDRLALAEEEKGDMAAAAEQLGKALTIAEALAQATGSESSRLYLSRVYRRLGHIAESKGELSSSVEYYRKSLAVREALAAETGSAESRYDLSDSYLGLGSAAESMGDLSLAREYYEKALAIREPLSKESGAGRYRRGLAVVLSSLGGLSEEENDLPAARQYYSRSLEICEAIGDETGSLDSYRDVAICHLHLGGMAMSEDDLPSARRHFEYSFRLCKALNNVAATVRSRLDLGSCCNRLGSLAEAEGDYEKAREYYGMALEIEEAVASETGTAASRRSLSVALSNLGDAVKSGGDLSEALKYYERSLEIREELARETELIQARKDLAAACLRLAEAAADAGDIPRAESCYERFIMLREELAEKEDSDDSRVELATAYFLFGCFCGLRLGDKQRAGDMFRKLIELSDGRGGSGLEDLREQAEMMLRLL